MMRFRNFLLAACAGLLLAAAARAQDPIRFARLPDISADGKLVAFSYLGDVWVVETIGGVARPVTLHEAHDTAPAFSPDGKWLAFSSNRHGSYDVFVVAAQGGRPRRLTFDSAADMVCGWSPDGKNVLFASTRSTDFPAGYQLYTVPFEGGQVHRVTVAEGKEGVYSPHGDQIAYVRGQGLWYRKGYRGSSNDDVWVCNADGSNNRQMTTFAGQDTSPMWGADGQTLYYVSELFGTPANVVKQDLAGKKPPQPVTFHKDEAVRRARISANGDWIVYECGADLYVASTHEGYPPRKLAIEVHADDKVNPDLTKTFTDGATEFAPSYDEKHVAFVVHGDLFLMPLGGGTGKVTRLTDHPAYDHGIAWAPDSSKIAFLSDRGGQEDIYLLEPNDPEHPKLVEAHRFKTTQLTNSSDAEEGVSFSPDGKRIGFLRGGKLWTMNPDGTDPKAVVNEVKVIDYEWSPDSKWLCYARLDGSFASELYIIPSTGATADNPARNVTRHATFNAGVTWNYNGKPGSLAFISERRQGPGMYVLPLQRPAAPGAPSSTDIDWDDIHLRAQLVAPIPAEEGAISPDGSKVAFRAGAGGSDLWVASSSGGQIARVTNGNMHPQQITWSRRFPNTVYFHDGRGQLYMVNLGGMDLGSLLSGKSPGVGGGTPVPIPFKVKLTVKRDEEFSEMFEQSWRALAENFYDAKFHGIDWVAVRARYRPLVRHCALKEDLYALISLMMGELNASHLGISGPGPVPDEMTADLGLVFDDSYRGPGLKIAAVLKRGPADRRGLNLKAGQLLTSIDGTELTERTNLSELLNGKAGEAVALEVLANLSADPKDPKARQRVEVQAAERGQVQHLMYERWVEHNAQRVAELSKGKLGYIHIPTMDDAGLDRFVTALYSDNFDKEAIVLDVRYNGGGFTHDQVLNYLGAREHVVFRQRDGGEGLVLRRADRKWTRPLVLLINNRSYSDAEIFPNAFKTLGLGKLVGVPTGGHVIGTSSVPLIDGSSFRIPQIGVFTMKGEDMETHGVTPDVLVDENPDQLARGIDAQLDKAVEVLQQDVAVWKKTHTSVAGKADDGKAAGTPVATPVPMPAPAVPPAGSK